MGHERLEGQFRDAGGVISCDTTMDASGRAVSSTVPPIRTILSDGMNEYRILLPNDPENGDLLRVLRDDVLCERIPVHDVDSVDLLRSRLNGEEEGVSLVAILAGKNLSDAFNRVAKGGCLAELYTHPHTNEAHAHLTYLVACTEGEGIGKFLIQSRIALLEEMARARNVPLRTIFIEVCDANEANKQKFLKLGAQPGPAGYCRPDVEESSVIVYDYADMYYPVGGRYPDAKAIEEARACYWRAQGISDPHAHPDFAGMVEKAQDWHGFERTQNLAFEAGMAGFRARHGFQTAAVSRSDTPPISRKRAVSGSGWSACHTF